MDKKVAWSCSQVIYVHEHSFSCRWINNLTCVHHHTLTPTFFSAVTNCSKSRDKTSSLFAFYPPYFSISTFSCCFSFFPFSPRIALSVQKFFSIFSRFVKSSACLRLNDRAYRCTPPRPTSHATHDSLGISLWFEKHVWIRICARTLWGTAQGHARAF